jgi:ABC-2 type transport system ATP-binding protein
MRFLDTIRLPAQHRWASRPRFVAAAVSEPPPARDVVEAEGLTKRFGEATVVSNVDLRVPRGTAFGYLGPNGAGKTTLIRMLLGLTKPTAGAMKLLGLPLPAARRTALARVGAIVDEPRFHGHLSGRQNLWALAAAREPEAHGRIDGALERVGLADRADDRVSTYSMGMRQRLGIAAALLNDPRLLLLDEPANGLDPAGIVGMRETLRSLAAQGRTVLVSSHILSEVEQLADVVGIVAAGRLVREGPIAELLATEGEVRIRVDPEQVAVAGPVLERILGQGAVRLDDAPSRDWLVARCDPARAADLNRALAEAGVYASRITAGATLEDLFLEVTATSPDVRGTGIR